MLTGVFGRLFLCVCVAAVVLDCVNMAPAAGKVTPKDSQYAAALETRFPALPPRGALFQALQNAKFDVSGGFPRPRLYLPLSSTHGAQGEAFFPQV